MLLKIPTSAWTRPPDIFLKFRIFSAILLFIITLILHTLFAGRRSKVFWQAGGGLFSPSPPTEVVSHLKLPQRSDRNHEKKKKSTRRKRRRQEREQQFGTFLSQHPAGVRWNKCHSAEESQRRAAKWLLPPPSAGGESSRAPLCCLSQ